MGLEDAIRQQDEDAVAAAREEEATKALVLRLADEFATAAAGAGVQPVAIQVVSHEVRDVVAELPKGWRRRERRVEVSQEVVTTSHGVLHGWRLPLGSQQGWKRHNAVHFVTTDGEFLPSVQVQIGEDYYSGAIYASAFTLEAIGPEVLAEARQTGVVPSQVDASTIEAGFADAFRVMRDNRGG